MIEICGEHSKNVKRWRNGIMALRWYAAGMLEADHQFRRVGHMHLPKLCVTVNRHYAEISVAHAAIGNTKQPDGYWDRHPKVQRNAGQTSLLPDCRLDQ